MEKPFTYKIDKQGPYGHNTREMLQRNIHLEEIRAIIDEYSRYSVKEILSNSLSCSGSDCHRIFKYFIINAIMRGLHTYIGLRIPLLEGLFYSRYNLISFLDNIPNNDSYRYMEDDEDKLNSFYKFTFPSQDSREIIDDYMQILVRKIISDENHLPSINSTDTDTESIISQVENDIRSQILNIYRQRNINLVELKLSLEEQVKTYNAIIKENKETINSLQTDLQNSLDNMDNINILIDEINYNKSEIVIYKKYKIIVQSKIEEANKFINFFENFVVFYFTNFMKNYMVKQPDIRRNFF